MTRAGHLVSRFLGSIGAPRLDAADETWVRLVLTDAELECWQRLGRADKAESVAVARRLARELGPDLDACFLAAALLHDVGKADARLGTLGRAGATVVAAAVSHGRARAWPNRVGAYVNHDELGAQRLRAAGARPEAVEWARAHHRPEFWARTGIPRPMCQALARADGEKVLGRSE